jgi:cytochrome P450
MLIEYRWNKYRQAGALRSPIKPLLGTGIFTADGTSWHDSRTLLRPIFTNHPGLTSLSRLEAHIANLIDQIPSDGSTADLQPLFKQLTLSAAFEMLFGVNLGSLNGAQGQEDFGKILEVAVTDVAERARLGPIYWFLAPFRLHAWTAVRRCKLLVGELVRETVRRGANQSQDERAKTAEDDAFVFFRELVKEDRKTDVDRIRDECLSLLVAARDTTASLLSTLWWLLARHPAVWSRLGAEIEGLDIRGLPPTLEQLRELKYLNACIKEGKSFKR